MIEQGNVNETAQKEHVGHIPSVALKWCQIPGNGQNHNFWKWLALHTWLILWDILSLSFAPSEVISSFLFLRNTFQFLGRHSKCDVWRVSHHWETGKTWQNKCFERKPLKCPQGVLRHQNCLYIFYINCQKRWFSTKYWIWALVAAFFPSEMFTGAITFKH